MNSPLPADRGMSQTSSVETLSVQVQSQLESAFAAPFSRWRRGSHGWTVCSDDPSTNRVLPAELVAWFDRLADDPVRSAQVRTLSCGATYVAAVLTADDAAPSLVAGEVELDAGRLASCTVDLAVQQALQRWRADAQQELVDQYAARLIESYEELTFLRRLTRHVEYCVADRSLSDAAGEILPQLRDLLALEGLCLFAADSASGGTRFGQEIEVSGVVPGASETWREFIEGLGDAARRVFVRNYCGVINQEGAPPLTEVRSVALAPIEKDGVVFGWLLGINKQPQGEQDASFASNSLWHDEIGSMEASLLEAAALVLGSHASNHQLFQEKETLVVDVIHTLVGVIEAKDSYTCGHSDRVALMAKCLGAKLGLSAEDCQDIFLSGLLHDIGKIGVADDVLLKPGSLSEDDFAQIKRHPETGAELLRGLTPLENLIPGVLHHHEAIDGSGYPGGLKGEEIPLMARILAVADAYDAMTSDRPYRPGMPLAKAESILRNGAGTQWDPQVVAAFFGAHEEIAEIRCRWQDHLNHLLNLRSRSRVGRDAIGPATVLATMGLSFEHDDRVRDRGEGAQA